MNNIVLGVISLALIIEANRLEKKVNGLQEKKIEEAVQEAIKLEIRKKQMLKFLKELKRIKKQQEMKKEKKWV